MYLRNCFLVQNIYYVVTWCTANLPPTFASMSKSADSASHMPPTLGQMAAADAQKSVTVGMAAAGLNMPTAGYVVGIFNLSLLKYLTYHNLYKVYIYVLL